jgi:hypothetical protein
VFPNVHPGIIDSRCVTLNAGEETPTIPSFLGDKTPDLIPKSPIDRDRRVRLSNCLKASFTTRRRPYRFSVVVRHSRMLFCSSK